MKPLRLTLDDFRSYASATIDFADGAVAVVGSNGAGKSSLLEALDVALFGARSLADYVRDGAETMSVELTFMHAGGTYRVRRGYSRKGRGKPFLDLERLWTDAHPTEGAHGFEWQPLTRGSIAETQDAIEQLLGLTRETLCASALLRQGAGDSFTAAQPRDRKRLLAATLGLGVWDDLLELARADKRAAEQELAGVRARLADADTRLADRPTIESDALHLAAAEKNAEQKLTEAQQAHAAAVERVQALERAEETYQARATAEHAARERLQAHERLAADAMRAWEQRAQLTAEMRTLPTAEQVAALEAEDDRVREAVAEHEREAAAYEARAQQAQAARDERRRLEAQFRAHTEQADALCEQADELAARARHVIEHVGSERCDRCRQVLNAEAAEEAARSLKRDGAEMTSRARVLREQAAMLLEQAGAIIIPAVPAEPPTLDPATRRTATHVAMALAEARLGLEHRATLLERERGLRATIAATETPDYQDTLVRLRAEHEQAAEALAAVPARDAKALRDARESEPLARALADSAATTLRETRDRLVRASTLLEQLADLDERAQTDRAEQERLQARLDDLQLLERAYGRDGVPALIVSSSAIPAIEAEANRILADLGTTYRVELRTERQKQDGGLTDTLDVIVETDTGARAYESFSGGERTRVNLALRIALAELLAGRRNADVQLLALDEPDGLDAAGFAALTGVLHGLQDRFAVILVVSHHPDLRDAFDNTIRVENTDGISRLTGEQQPVAA